MDSTATAENETVRRTATFVYLGRRFSLKSARPRYAYARLGKNGVPRAIEEAAALPAARFDAAALYYKNALVKSPRIGATFAAQIDDKGTVYLDTVEMLTTWPNDDHMADWTLADSAAAKSVRLARGWKDEAAKAEADLNERLRPWRERFKYARTQHDRAAVVADLLLRLENA